MCYDLMMFFWSIDDWLKARKLAWLGAPFSWIGDRFEDFGLEHGLLDIKWDDEPASKITIEEIAARTEADLAQGKYTVIENPEQLENFLNELEAE